VFLSDLPTPPIFRGGVCGLIAKLPEKKYEEALSIKVTVFTGGILPGAACDFFIPDHPSCPYPLTDL